MNLENIRNRIDNWTEQIDGINNSLENFINSLNPTFDFLATAIEKISNDIDKSIQESIKLNLIVDDNNTIETLEKKLMNSAFNSDNNYQEVVDNFINFGMKTDDVFSNNDELIVFLEAVNKELYINGVSNNDKSEVINELINVLSGEFENIDYLIDTIPHFVEIVESYMNWEEGSIEDYVENKVLSAEIVKNAIISSYYDIDEKFNNTPKILSQSWADAINTMTVITKPFVDILFCLVSNIDIILPLIFSIVAAFSLYAIVTNTVIIVTTILAKAMDLLNFAIGLNPVMKIVMGFIVLIGVISSVVNAINKGGEEFVTVLGFIAGICNVVLSGIANAFIGVFNGIVTFLNDFVIGSILSFVEWIVNIFNGGFDNVLSGVFNFIGKIISAFISFAKIITRIIDSIFDLDWTSKLDTLKNKVSNWGKNDNAITLEKNSSINIVDSIDYRDSFDKGNKFGTDIQNNIKNYFNDESSKVDYKSVIDSVNKNDSNNNNNNYINVDMSNMNNNISSNNNIDDIINNMVSKTKIAMSGMVEGY